MKIKFKRAYSAGTLLQDGTLNIQEGRFDGFLGGKADLDLSEYRVFPGFIDAHTHGGAGIDCMKASMDELNTLSQYYASNGVTGFLATTVTQTMDAITSCAGVISDRMEAGTDGAEILGIYLEGPHLSPKFRGAHEESLLRDINLDEIKTILDAARGNLKVFAIAPEKEGALEAIQYIISRGAKVALGHSAANMDEAKLGFNAGARILIHTYNAMAGLNHRNVGLLGTALTRDDVYCEMICDLIHVCKEALDIVFRCKSADKVVLITDSMEAAGMPDGECMLGRLPVIVKDGIARTKEGALAGSTLRSNLALKNVVETVGIPIERAMKALTCNPAAELGLSNELGSLDAGKRANLTALDDDYNVVLTMVDGQIVYDKR